MTPELFIGLSFGISFVLIGVTLWRVFEVGALFYRLRGFNFDRWIAEKAAYYSGKNVRLNSADLHMLDGFLTSRRFVRGSGVYLSAFDALTNLMEIAQLSGRIEMITAGRCPEEINMAFNHGFAEGSETAKKSTEEKMRDLVSTTYAKQYKEAYDDGYATGYDKGFEAGEAHHVKNG